MLSILFVGGAGHWAEKHYYPALLELRREGFKFRLTAICDVNDPYKLKPDHFIIGQRNLEQFLREDNPFWCQTDGLNDAKTIAALNDLHAKFPIDLIFISCDPKWHYIYSIWAIENNINVVCEKPPFLTDSASGDVSAARRLSIQFQSLNDLLEKKRNENPSFLFYIPLKNRRLLPFKYIASGLFDIHKKTGQGLSHLNLTVNNGLHRYPDEFLNEGAHGYLDGIGSLSHSSYHYLDIIAWYINCAKGKIARLGLSLPFVFRVRDYLNSGGYQSLSDLLNKTSSPDVLKDRYPERLLNAELDLLINIALYDKNNNRLGLISYHSNHMSFNPRILPCNTSILEPGNHKQGGKMKQVIMDIHQGALQNFLLFRNHENIEPKQISVTRRLHPLLGENYKHTDYLGNLYIAESDTTDVLRNIFRSTIDPQAANCYKTYFSTWQKETLTHLLFAKSYELIAEQSNNNQSLQETSVDI